jgi:GNAT superfamily N-acetyltransferase
MEIRLIHPEEVWGIRQQVLWPEKPLAYIQLPEDEWGLHYGGFQNNRLVSVVSLFIEGEEAQFRKFATLEEEQGKGYGSHLLRHVLDIAAGRGVRRVWCNARTHKAGFYAGFGLKPTGAILEKDGVSFVIMERLSGS